MTSRFHKGLKILVGLLVVAMVAAFAAAGTAGCQKETRPSEISAAFSDDISNIDPAGLSIAIDRAVAENIYDGLTRFNLKTYEVEPALATEWEVSPDGKEYTFHLRQGVQFHKNYGEMTSEDVAFSFLRHKDPEVKSREAGTYSVVERVDTPDKYTVKVVLKNPVPSLPNLLAWQTGFIVSKKAVTELGADYQLNPIGTGPYYFDSWVQKEKIVLKAFPDSWRGKPMVDQVTIRVIPDETIAVDAVARGELDMVALYQVAAYKAARSNPNVRLFEGKSGYVNYLYVQTQFPPTNDIRVRQAIAYALDIPAMQQAVGGMLMKNETILNPLCVGYAEVFAGKYPHDVEKAKALLKEANLPKDTKLVIYYRKAHLYETIALMVKDQLEEVIPIDLVQLEASVQSSKFKEGKFNIGIWATTRLESDLYMSQHILSTGGGNYTKYNNPEADALINAARSELDLAKRADLYKQVQEIVARDLPMISTGLMASVIVCGKDVKDVWTHPYPGIIPFDTVVMED